jgi:hypothetical protein
VSSKNHLIHVFNVKLMNQLLENII